MLIDKQNDHNQTNEGEVAAATSGAYAFSLNKVAQAPWTVSSPINILSRKGRERFNHPSTVIRPWKKDAVAITTVHHQFPVDLLSINQIWQEQLDELSFPATRGWPTDQTKLLSLTTSPAFATIYIQHWHNCEQSWMPRGIDRAEPSSSFLFMMVRHVTGNCRCERVLGSFLGKPPIPSRMVGCHIRSPLPGDKKKKICHTLGSQINPQSSYNVGTFQPRWF